MDSPPDGEQRQCPYCQQPFIASRFHPEQQVCSKPDCQRSRRTSYHRRKRHDDPGYAQDCRDSNEQWRAAHPHYQKQYWKTHSEARARNLQTQRARDQRRRLCNLVKNNVALDLTQTGASVYLLGPAAADLVKNTLAQSKLLILQPLPPPETASCKEHSARFSAPFGS